MVYRGTDWALIRSDCVRALSVFGANRFDSCVTDPPYELGFMGKRWDASGIAFSVELWREVLRVLKPGAHLLAFGGTRTYHRMTCAIEDAGFEIRDSLHWLYGTGFPKSLNVSKAIDEMAGETQPVIVPGASGRGAPSVNALGAGLNVGFAERPKTAPVTAAAAAWHGWGTALKPGHEPVVLARKPLEGTVAANVLARGTGALNIDASRIGTPKNVPASPAKDRIGQNAKGDERGRTADTSGFDPNVGRWPANVLLDEAAAAELDAQSGTDRGCKGTRSESTARNGVTDFSPRQGTLYTDSGGASRFFYVAKPNRAERDRGCEHLPARTGGEATDRADGSAGVENPRAGAGRTGGARNYHPTVKPVALMRYLVRLVTPPGGTVLDPFTGSGTTGMASRLEGFQFVGIEREPDFFEIAKARIGVAA